jgi:hypothetical protein
MLCQQFNQQVESTAGSTIMLLLDRGDAWLDIIKAAKEIGPKWPQSCSADPAVSLFVSKRIIESALKDA